MQLDIKANNRLTLVGKTESGKTTLALALTKYLRRLVVFDPKGTLGTPEWKLEDWTREGLSRLDNGEPIRMRVPAPISGNWDQFFQQIYGVGNCVVYIDEVYGVVPPGTKPSPYFTALYTRGRELNIGVFAATQRPSWIPLFVLSEAEWLFVFRLLLLKDRQAVAEIGGPDLLTQIPTRDPYGFWVYNTAWDRPVYSEGLILPRKKRRSA